MLLCLYAYMILFPGAPDSNYACGCPPTRPEANAWRAHVSSRPGEILVNISNIILANICVTFFFNKAHVSFRPVQISPFHFLKQIYLILNQPPFSPGHIPRPGGQGDRNAVGHRQRRDPPHARRSQHSERSGLFVAFFLLTLTFGVNKCALPFLELFYICLLLIVLHFPRSRKRWPCSEPTKRSPRGR